jgi:polynucleotide 5'-hydroxyl-kinase GRC3/NOL9
VDCGKSTFCLLAANQGLKAGRKPALLDTDPGQSDIGPPASLGLALVENPLQSLDEAVPAGLHFIGATSPVGHLLEIAVGAQRLAQRARGLGADLIIVNTSGLVKGGIARALKSAKIRLLSPSHIISIAPREETEAILAALPKQEKAHSPAVYRLTPSPRAVSRTAEERRRRRESKFAAYFREAGEISLAFSNLALQGGAWLTGEPLDGVSLSYAEECLQAEVLWGERTSEGAFFVVGGEPNRFGEESLAETYEGPVKVIERPLLENLLVGLINHDGEDIALGIIKAVDFKKRRLTMLFPPAGGAEIAGLRMGNLRLSAEGIELGTLPPSIWG